jgi:periplasmic protein CpxP/Spy
MDAGPGMMPFGGRHLQRMLDEAKATDAQRKQIDAIADKARADLQALRTEGKKLHEQGLALWGAAKLDTRAIEAHRQQMLKHHDRMSARTTQAMLETSQVLSPEQRASVVQGLQTHHQGMLQRMKHRMGWGEHGKPVQGEAAPAASTTR